MGIVSFRDKSRHSDFAGAYYKNCIQRELHCSVFQATDAAFQWH